MSVKKNISVAKLPEQKLSYKNHTYSELKLEAQR